jgi:hypothetical protein
MNRQSQSQNVKNTNNDPQNTNNDPQNTNNDPQNTNNDLQNATLKTMDLTTQKTMGINLESEKLGIKRRVEIS